MIRLFTIKEVAEILRVSHYTVRREIARGKIRALRLSPNGKAGTFRIGEDEIKRIESLTVNAS